MRRRLTKSENKILAGVLGGIANYFNLDQTLVRLIGLAIIIFTGFFPGLFFYLAAAVIMPEYNERDHTMDGKFRKQ